MHTMKHGCERNSTLHTVAGVYQPGLYLHIMHANSQLYFEITQKVIIMSPRNIETVAVKKERVIIRAWQEKLAD